jgi:integrase
MTERNKNPNHPEKGATIRVDPIRRPEDIAAIKQILSGTPRDLLLFTMGINNGLRVGDLLRLKVKDVKSLKPGEFITIKENKTGKQNILMVNKSVHKALKDYLQKVHPEDDDYLFASRKTRAPLTIQAVNAMVKKWTKTIHLDHGNYGAHTLRKTFGFMQRTKYGVGFEVLARRFNHANPTTTMRYLGLTSDEVNEVLMNEI